MPSSRINFILYLSLMKNLNLTFLSIITLFFFSACKKDKSPDKSTTTNQYYVKATINNAPIDWEVTDNNTNWVPATASQGSSDEGVFTGSLTAQIYGAKNYLPLIGIDFRTLYLSYEDDKTAYFNNFVTTGAWNFAVSPFYAKDTKSVIVYYTDSNGHAYSSVSTHQTGTLKVVSVTRIPATLVDNEALKIKVAFSCILYPLDDSGDTIALTNVDATVYMEDLIPL
jgi:hypothetical protein